MLEQAYTSTWQSVIKIFSNFVSQLLITAIKKLNYKNLHLNKLHLKQSY